MEATATTATAFNVETPRAFAQVFTEQEAVKMLGAAEVAKHKGHKLCSLTIALGAVALDKRGVAPDRVPLFALGANESTKGTFYLTETSAVDVIKAEADYGNDLVIDRDHMALFGDSTAYGWFSLELDAKGLWAGAPRNNEQDGLTGIWWLTEGRDLVESYKFRYISPVFWTTYDDQGREIIVEVLNFSLTNIPATKNRAPLSNSRGQESAAMDPVETTVSVTTAAPQPSAPAPAAISAPATPDGVLSAVYALTGETDPARILGKLSALSTLSETLRATSAVLATERQAHGVARAELRALKVDGYIREKRLPPSMREKALAMQPEALSACLELLASMGNLPTVAAVEQPAVNSTDPAAPATTLSTEEVALCDRYKLDKTLFAANKLKLYPRGGVATDAL